MGMKSFSIPPPEITNLKSDKDLETILDNIRIGMYYLSRVFKRNFKVRNFGSASV